MIAISEIEALFRNEAFATLKETCVALRERAERAERERDCYHAARVTWPDHVLAAIRAGDVEACAADAKARHANWTALEREVAELREERDLTAQAHERAGAELLDLQARLNGADQRAAAYQRELTEARAELGIANRALSMAVGLSGPQRCAMHDGAACELPASFCAKHYAALEAKLAQARAALKLRCKRPSGSGSACMCCAARWLKVEMRSESATEDDSVHVKYRAAMRELTETQRERDDVWAKANAERDLALAERDAADERLAVCTVEATTLRGVLTAVREREIHESHDRVIAALATPSASAEVLRERDNKTRWDAVELYRRRRVVHRDTERGREVVSFGVEDEAEALEPKLDAALARVGVLREALETANRLIHEDCDSPSHSSRRIRVLADPDKAAAERDERLKAEARNAAEVATRGAMVLLLGGNPAEQDPVEAMADRDERVAAAAVLAAATHLEERAVTFKRAEDRAMFALAAQDLRTCPPDCLAKPPSEAKTTEGGG